MTLPSVGFEGIEWWNSWFVQTLIPGSKIEANCVDECNDCVGVWGLFLGTLALISICMTRAGMCVCVCCDGGPFARAVALTPPLLLNPLTRCGSQADPFARVMRTARERCRDEKGVVRKAAVQLLASLVLLQQQQQQRGAGSGATPLAAADLAAIETAAGDSLVWGGAAWHDG